MTPSTSSTLCRDVYPCTTRDARIFGTPTRLRNGVADRSVRLAALGRRRTPAPAARRPRQPTILVATPSGSRGRTAATRRELVDLLDVDVVSRSPSESSSGDGTRTARPARPPGRSRGLPTSPSCTDSTAAERFAGRGSGIVAGLGARATTTAARPRSRSRRPAVAASRLGRRQRRGGCGRDAAKFEHAARRRSVADAAASLAARRPSKQRVDVLGQADLVHLAQLLSRASP